MNVITWAQTTVYKNATWLEGLKKKNNNIRECIIQVIAGRYLTSRNDNFLEQFDETKELVIEGNTVILKLGGK